MTGIPPSFPLLAAMAGVALWLTISRGKLTDDAPTMRAAVGIAAIATVAQAGHFAEELTAGLHEQFPAVLGQEPFPRRLFVAYNLTALLIWAISVWGLAQRWPIALFLLWFLGIAGVVNGILHPLLALNAGGYFPGLATSPLMAVVGALLLHRLWRVTA